MPTANLDQLQILLIEGRAYPSDQIPESIVDEALGAGTVKPKLCKRTFKITAIPQDLGIYVVR